MGAPAPERLPEAGPWRGPTGGREAGVVTGIAAEARVLLRALPALGPGLSHDGLEARLACAGADPARARACAERLLAEGATALLSFGIAGGLDPALRAGSLILPEAVLAQDRSEIAVDPAWRARVLERLQASGGIAAPGLLLGSTVVVASRAEKAARFRACGACAVDMESCMVAEVAREAGVPFMVARAIADPAERSLPSFVVGSIGEDGEPRHRLIAGRLVMRPWRLRALVQLRQDARQALAALSMLARTAGPVLLGRV